jgi:riboflavin kinase / FMN adenylyltransferase
MSEKTILRLSDPVAVPARLKGGVVAIGNFDGVHRGHQAVLERALSAAKEAGVPAMVLTFEPHPRSLFQPDRPIDRLTPAHIKARILGILGFDAVVEEPFTQVLAQTSAEAFVERIIVDGLAASRVVTGFDFHFGKGREGGPAFLMEAGSRRGFAVTLVDAFRNEAAEVVSSSAVRMALSKGEVAEAAGLLGYRYTVERPVIQGNQLGRTLNYPTANMALPDATSLAHGIYAVRLRRADGSLHDGVASFGRRPTIVPEGAPLLETYVFDFNGDLYGEAVSVSFFGFLRPEQKFEDLDALVVQMRRDEAEARALLSGVTPLDELDRILCF